MGTLKPRGRPRKIRYIKGYPTIQQFSPRGRPGRPDEVVLTLDQLEAIKLADGQGLTQRDAAQVMGVSRSTFGRILREARSQVALALADGKIVRVRGGSVALIADL